MTGQESPVSQRVPVPVDGHAHLHDSIEVERYLDAALANFRGAAPFADPAGVLLVMEPGSAETFRRLRDNPSAIAPAWRLQGLEDEVSLAASRSTGERIILVAGRQVATAEGLEILLAGALRADMQGLPFESALAAAMELESAIPILPWGFGKWWGGRGRLVRGAIERYGIRLCIGDNGGRPRHTPEPTLLAEARKRGVKVVPGSDPLPLAFELNRIGSYGFWCSDTIRPTHPFDSIRRYLRTDNLRLGTYGHRRSWVGFARSQTALRMSWLRLDRPSPSGREIQDRKAAG